MEFNSTFQLFINGEEYDFNNEVRFYFHPTNFSSVTLNNVVKKENNSWPNITNIIDFKNEFTICELKQNNKTFFIGIVNDIGRLSLLPNKPKTFSIQISDFRKWLSLTKPINELYINKTPTFIVNDLISKLKEPRIKVGNLRFSTPANYTIKAYNTTSKTLYQILKDVIERQTNSTLYFTIENNNFYINYKAANDFKTTSDQNLDITNYDFLLNNKIIDVTFDNETNEYYNYLAYTSDNTISKLFTTEFDLPVNEEKIVLFKPVGKIIESPSMTFYKNKSNGSKIIPVILNSNDAKEGKFCHLIWNEGSNTLENKWQTNDYLLTISYKTKQKLTLEAKNEAEITRLSNVSNTKGIVYKTEKFNDISDPDDLLAAVKNDLEKYSTPSKILTLTCKEFIWNILDAVNVININDELNGVYIVQSMEGKFKRIGSSSIVDKEITYILKQTRNFNTLANKFDNQSYRDTPATSNYVVENIDTITSKHILVFENNTVDTYSPKYRRWG